MLSLEMQEKIDREKNDLKFIEAFTSSVKDQTKTLSDIFFLGSTPAEPAVTLIFDFEKKQRVRNLFIIR